MPPVTAHAVYADGKVKVLQQEDFVKRIAAAKWGQGTSLVVRVEPEDEAWRHSDVKHLFGHVYGPVVEYCGYTKLELHKMAKAQFMPEGKTSLTELNREEMKEYTSAVEQWLRTECGEAFEFVGI